MHNSPGTPTGTRSNPRSRTSRRVLATGPPIGTTASPATHRCQLTSTAASVGPYKFSNHTPGNRSMHRAANSALNTSPEHTTRRNDPNRPDKPGSSKNTSNIDGTKCTVVTPSAAIKSTKYPESRCPPGAATTNPAPTDNGQNNSHTDTSNENGVLCTTRSPAPNANTS